MPIEIQMRLVRETKNFRVFEHPQTRQSIYLHNSTIAGTPLETAETVLVTVAAVR